MPARGTAEQPGFSPDDERPNRVLHGMPVVAMSALDGSGVPGLVSALGDACSSPRASRGGRARWVAVGRIVSGAQKLKHRHHSFLERLIGLQPCTRWAAPLSGLVGLVDRIPWPFLVAIAIMTNLAINAVSKGEETELFTELPRLPRAEPEAAREEARRSHRRVLRRGPADDRGRRHRLEPPRRVRRNSRGDRGGEVAGAQPPRSARGNSRPS